MNKVECKVQSCAYNSQNLCSLDKINVDGPAAKEKAQTCCASFAEKKDSAMNSVSVYNVTEDTGIHCKAENCSYNRNRKCDADHICVDSSANSVSTMSGTNCATFVGR